MNRTVAGDSEMMTLDSEVNGHIVQSEQSKTERECLNATVKQLSQSSQAAVIQKNCCRTSERSGRRIASAAIPTVEDTESILCRGISVAWVLELAAFYMAIFNPAWLKAWVLKGQAYRRIYNSLVRRTYRQRALCTNPRRLSKPTIVSPLRFRVHGPISWSRVSV